MSLVRDFKKLIRTMINAFMADVHTHLPAQVISYDENANTVSLKPCIKRIRTDDPNNPTTVELPVLNDVPVAQFGSTNFLLTVPPQENSYGTIHVSERELEQWLDKGGIVDPGSPRKFDLSDAIFEPGLWTLTGITGGVNTDRMELRTLDGSSFAALVNNGTFEVNGNADSAALTSKVDQFISDIDTLFRNTPPGTGWTPLAPPAVDNGLALQTAYLLAFPTPPLTVESTSIKTDA